MRRPVWAAVGVGGGELGSSLYRLLEGEDKADWSSLRWRVMDEIAATALLASPSTARHATSPRASSLSPAWTVRAGDGRQSFRFSPNLWRVSPLYGSITARMNSDVQRVNPDARIAIDVAGDPSLPRPGRRALVLGRAASGARGARAFAP